MAQKKSNTPLPLPSLTSAWDGIFGLLGCLLVFLVPFFPDEKLIRVKMQALELGLFSLLALIGFRIILTSSFPFSGFSTGNDGRRALSPLAVLSLAIFLWTAVQTVLAFLTPEAALAASEMRRVLLGACAFLTFAWASFTSEWERRLLTAWSLAASFLAMYGCLQVTGGLGPIQVPQMERVMGTYGNPIFFGAFLASSLFVTLAAASLQKKGPLRLMLYAGAVFQAFALYHTQTRGAWVAFGLAAAVGSFLQFKKKPVPKVFVLAAVIALGGFAYQTRGIWERDQGHLLIWRDTLRMWKDKPVMGVGLGSFHTVFPSYAQDDLKSKWPKGQFIVNYAHNEYLQTLAEGGLIGFLSFFAVLTFLAIHFIRRLRSADGSPPDSCLMFLALAGFTLLVQNFFSVDMRFGISFASFFMMAGLGVSRGAAAEKRWVPLTNAAWPPPVRFVGSALWAVFLILIMLPPLLKPYQAQKAVSAKPDFFDERVLDPAKSIQDLEALARQYPEEPAVLDKLAYVYAKEMKTADNKINVAMANAAVATYETLIRVDPKRLSAYNNLANINYTLGKTDEAIRMWRKCTELDPAFLDAHLNLGKTLYVKGDLKESAAEFQKVLQLNPGNSEAIVYLKRMVE